MRNIVATAKGGRPVFARGQCGSTICTSETQGATRSISSRNWRLRVFLVDKFSPSPSCFMGFFRLPLMDSTHANCGPVLQTFPNCDRTDGLAMPAGAAKSSSDEALLEGLTVRQRGFSLPTWLVCPNSSCALPSRVSGYVSAPLAWSAGSRLGQRVCRWIRWSWRLVPGRYRGVIGVPDRLAEFTSACDARRRGGEKSCR